MPTSYTINSIQYSSPPQVNQVVTIQHKVQGQPDSSYVTDSNSVNVNVNGTLVSPYTITGLSFSTGYTIRVINNCGGQSTTKNFFTPPDPCPNIIGITGSVAAG